MSGRPAEHGPHDLTAVRVTFVCKCGECDESTVTLPAGLNGEHRAQAHDLAWTRASRARAAHLAQIASAIRAARIENLR